MFHVHFLLNYYFLLHGLCHTCSYTETATGKSISVVPVVPVVPECLEALLPRREAGAVVHSTHSAGAAGAPMSRSRPASGNTSAHPLFLNPSNPQEVLQTREAEQIRFWNVVRDPVQVELIDSS